MPPLSFSFSGFYTPDGIPTNPFENVHLPSLSSSIHHSKPHVTSFGQSHIPVILPKPHHTAIAVHQKEEQKMKGNY